MSLEKVSKMTDEQRERLKALVADCFSGIDDKKEFVAMNDEFYSYYLDLISDLAVYKFELPMIEREYKDED